MSIKRSVKIKDVEFDVSFSTRVLSYYMRKKKIGTSGDKGLPTLLNNFGPFEVAEIYLLNIYLAFKDSLSPSSIKIDTEEGDRFISSVKVPTSTEPPTFGIPITITIDDVLMAMDDNPELLSMFSDSKDPGITVDTSEGGDEGEEKK